MFMITGYARYASRRRKVITWENAFLHGSVFKRLMATAGRKVPILWKQTRLTCGCFSYRYKM